MTYKNISIIFQNSTSQQFPFALREARKNSTFKEEGKTYSVTYTKDQCAEMHKLVELLKNVRSRRVFVDGEERMWDDVFHYLWCYRLRQKAYDPEEYCSGSSTQYPAYNPWYCIQVGMPFSHSMEWLHYGRFDTDGTWLFDKAKIAHYLKTNAHEFRFCPAYNPAFMMRVLDAFPETANPRIDPNWVYSEPIDRSLCISIEIGSFGPDKKTRYYSGVVPASPVALKNIVNKIFAKLSAEDHK